MSIRIDPHPYVMDNIRTAAKQMNKTVNSTVTEVLETMFGGKCAYIVLNPAPSEKVLTEVREAVDNVINRYPSIRKEGSLYVPDEKSSFLVRP